MELLDCVLIGICTVISVNTVLILEQLDLYLHGLIRFVHSNVQGKLGCHGNI